MCDGGPLGDSSRAPPLATVLPPRRLSILAPTQYPWLFNGPRESRHRVERRDFVPFNYVSPKIEGITIFNPLPPRRFDLIHAFNRIPLSTTPFVMGFEAYLPRGFGMEGGAYWKALLRLLASDRCRGLVVISEYGRRVFRNMHEGAPEAEALFRKLHLRYPNMPVPDVENAIVDGDLDEIRVVFVGNHFGRKGGCVAVKLAELALRAGFPLVVDIVSKLEVGGAIWTDPPRTEFFEPYLRPLRTLPNIRFHDALPNDRVLSLLRRSHLSLLPTFADSFGYSAIESMMNFTPVLATRQSALPEFITDGETGILLDLPVNRDGEWVHTAAPDRHTERFERIYRDEVQRLAEEALQAILGLVGDPSRFFAMRRRCREAAVRFFAAAGANRFWDGFYTRAAQGVQAAAVP